MPKKSFIDTHRRKLVALTVFVHVFALVVCLKLLGAFETQSGYPVPTSSGLDAQGSSLSAAPGRASVMTLDLARSGTTLYPRLRFAE